MTIILPNYNEENIGLMTRQLAYLYPYAEIIVSNDYDGRGKGWALRQGLERATQRPIIFIDGDNDIKVEEIAKLLPYLKQYDVVVGRKELPRSFKRRLITFLSRLYIRVLFGCRWDSQTGLKGFNYTPTWDSDSYAFDIEILAKARKNRKRIVEIPIHATVSDSKTMKEVWLVFLDSLDIWWRINIKGER